MRRIMNDRMYDTDKATLVVKYREELEDEPLFGSSFLYLKKTGEWFYTTRVVNTETHK